VAQRRSVYVVCIEIVHGEAEAVCARQDADAFALCHGVERLHVFVGKRRHRFFEVFFFHIVLILVCEFVVSLFDCLFLVGAFMNSNPLFSSGLVI
jgi:hypothetical protein